MNVELLKTFVETMLLFSWLKENFKEQRWFEIFCILYVFTVSFDQFHAF